MSFKTQADDGSTMTLQANNKTDDNSNGALFQTAIFICFRYDELIDISD